jgi:RIP metalloprotease RseP
MSVLAAIGVLALLILVHEMGHFLAARLQGIHVNRFSIGFGPILWKYQGTETEYALRALPLGGFVGFPDDDPDSNIPENDPDLLRNRPLLDRAIVISAGVIANLIFAYLVLVLQLGLVGSPEASEPGILVPRIIREVAAVTAPAEQAGIKPGDVILKVNGQDFTKTSNFDESLSESFNLQSGKPVQLEVRRKDERKPLDITITPPANAKGQSDLGIQIAPTAADKAGIRPGDVIVAANGRQFGQSLQETDVFRNIIRRSDGKPIQLTIERNGTTVPIAVNPQPSSDGNVRIGVELSPNGPEKNPIVYRRPDNVFTLFGSAAEEFQRIINLTVSGFGQLISNFSKTAEQVAGPVAIVAIGAKLAESNIASLLQFAALISINLAIINILPLPALDGGQLAFLAIEGIRGKPLPTHIQDGVMQTGLMLLLGLGIFLIIRDTANLIQQ